MKRPKGHTTYWVYSYSRDEREYDFGTTPRLDEAYAIVAEMLSQGWDHGWVFFGDKNGAYTDLDAVDSWRKKK